MLAADDALREAWFRFRDERLLEYARRWLHVESIDAELTGRLVRDAGPPSTA